MGAIHVPPEYMLTIDVLSFVALLSLGPAWRQSQAGAAMASWRAVTFVVGMLAGSGALIWSATQWRPAQIVQPNNPPTESAPGVRDFAVLTPTEWVGGSFPLLDRIDIGRDLSRGDWIVLFYRNNCEDCAQLMDEYDRKGNEAFGVTNDFQLALVEVDESGSVGNGKIVTRNGRWKLGKLDHSKRWVIQTPAVVLLGDGKVLAPRHGVGSIPGG
jgi:hypothetical protein